MTARHWPRKDSTFVESAWSVTQERKSSVERPLWVSINHVLTGHFQIKAKQFTDLKYHKKHGQDVEVLLVPEFCPAGQRQRLTVNERIVLI